MVATSLDCLNVIPGNYSILAGTKAVALTRKLAGRKKKKKQKEDNKRREGMSCTNILPEYSLWS